MDTIQHEGMEYAYPSPLIRLEHVPVGTSFLGDMMQVLTEHGASLTETADYPVADEPYKEFAITFPEGTRQFWGLRMMRSCYFVIQFPDGYVLHGGELWPLQRHEDDVATIVLHLHGRGKKQKEEGS